MAHSNIDTFNLPNYVGELFQKGQRPNTFLQMIGGVNPDILYASTEFPVGQQYQVPAHNTDRSRVEGAPAPDHAGVVRSQATNVTQIVQEAVAVTYTKLAAHQQLAGLNTGGASNPVQDELDFQTGVKMELVARNLNYSFLNNAYRKPANNTESRRTRGLLEAITSNVTDADDAAFDFDILDDVMAKMIASGAITDGDNVAVLANTTQTQIINAFFRRHKILVDSDRFIGGVRVRTVYGTFGVMNLVLDYDMPQDTLAVVNFDAIRVVGTPVPNKGVLFLEPLAKTGATEEYQLYGELGLDHGPEWLHGKITDLALALPDPDDDGDGGDDG